MNLALGDPHNFGKRVCFRGEGIIHKPRNIYWEWIFLGHDSPIRDFLNQLFAGSSVQSPIRTLPQLNFSNVPNPTSLILGGEISELKVFPPTSAQLSSADFESIGAVIALMLWSGMGDLHNDNIVFGITNEQRVVFGPIDIEGVFDDLYLLSQAHLISSRECPETEAGLLRLKNYLSEYSRSKFTGAILYGFVNSLELLFENEDKIFRVLHSIMPINQLTTRVIIRPTKEYYHILQNYRDSSFKSNLIASEAEQIARGDIPYFFRFLSSQEVYYFVKPDELKIADLTQDQQMRALHHARIWKDNQTAARKNKNDVIKISSLQLARYLSNGNVFKDWEYKDFRCSMDDHRLYLSFGVNSGTRTSLSCQKEAVYGIS